MEKRQRHSAAQWQALIERQAGSGLSQEAFCKQEKLGQSTFRRWKSRLAGPVGGAMPQESAPALFAALTPAPEREGHGGAGWEVELDLGGGVCLHIRRGGEC